MHSGITFNKTKEEILNPGIVKTEEVITRVTRDFDSTKHSVIFLDREWFRPGDIFDSGRGLLLLQSRFNRVSESDTVYRIKVHSGNPDEFIQLNIGDRLVLKGNFEDNKAKIAEQKRLYSNTSYSLTVHDNTRSSKLVYEPEIQLSTGNTIKVLQNFDLSKDWFISTNGMGYKFGMQGGIQMLKQ